MLLMSKTVRAYTDVCGNSFGAWPVHSVDYFMHWGRQNLSLLWL